MNKNLMCIILAAILLFTGSAFADTSIFVATDRHAKYETVNDPVEGNDSLPGNTSAGELPHKNDRRPPKKQMPAYDPCSFVTGLSSGFPPALFSQTLGCRLT